jgi:hypothetical protein
MKNSQNPSVNFKPIPSEFKDLLYLLTGYYLKLPATNADLKEHLKDLNVCSQLEFIRSDTYLYREFLHLSLHVIEILKNNKISHLNLEIQTIEIIMLNYHKHHESPVL